MSNNEVTVELTKRTVGAKFMGCGFQSVENLVEVNDPSHHIDPGANNLSSIFLQKN